MTGRIRYPRTTRRSSLSYGFGFGAFGALFALVVMFIIGFAIFEHSNTKTVTFTVQDKAIKTNCNNNGNCSSDYLIYTNKGVYKDTDSFWFLKFRSSDLYGNLHRGKTYTCKVYGFRVGLTSTYPNIISCKNV